MKLETANLVEALQTFGDRYQAVDVFADDLSDAARAELQGPMTFVKHGRTYRFTVFPDNGVVRLERLPEGQNAVGAMLAGAAIGAAVAAASKQRGEGVLGGALLGLLVGGLLTNASSDATSEPIRRVFAMEFDPATHGWVAYDGTLLRWMKDRLLQPA